MNTAELLQAFVNQRPGMDPRDYASYTDYRREAREITRDLHDFRALLSLAFYTVPNLDEKLTELLSRESGRLTLKNGRLEYCTGQYFPTEYRPAACRALVSILWRQRAAELEKSGEEYTGEDIRKYFRRRLPRRTAQNYFR